MSGLSPTRRLRTKTSDLTDFFRGSTLGRHGPKDANSSTNNLEVPSGDESTGLSKKKITRIPLFGRSRKKSNHSTASSPFASSVITRDSSDVGEQSSRTRSTDRHPATSSDPPGPLPSLLSQTPAPPAPAPAKPTIGSKLAAHFGHSRKSAISSQTTPVLEQPAATLSPIPASPRSDSFESGSSGGSKNRSTTPRPRPTITVSVSPNSLEQFRDLFTRPHPLPGSSSQTTLSPKQTLDAAPGSSSRTRPPDPPLYPRRGVTPASAIAAAHRHQQNSSSSSRNSSSKKNSDSDKGTDGSSTPRDSDARESPRLIVSEKDKGTTSRRPSVATTSSQSSEHASLNHRSRMKPPSSRSRPPSTPLPLPPSPVPPSPKLPAVIPQFLETQTPPAVPKSPYTRPRAHTIGSVPPTPTSTLILSSSQFNSGKPEAASLNGLSFNIDVASAEQLREALKARNAQYDELSAYVRKSTETHVAEIAALEQKITLLEKEATRREKEIAGLTWLINNDDSKQPKPLPPGILNPSRLSPPTSGVDSDQEIRRSRHSVLRRLQYASDSGTESRADSGGSGAESASSIIRGKKYRKPSNLVEATSNVRRSGSRRDQETTEMSGSVQNLKRLSVGSGGISPSSSVSSLLPPSPSITMSSLSAIPEGHSSSLNPTRYDSSSDQQEERRAIRASRRISTSSMASSSTAASSGYSSNIKRSRPPSIAQVLEKSPPNMDEVLEKLRPFA